MKNIFTHQFTTQITINIKLILKNITLSQHMGKMMNSKLFFY